MRQYVRYLEKNSQSSIFQLSLLISMFARPKYPEVENHCLHTFIQLPCLYLQNILCGFISSEYLSCNSSDLRDPTRFVHKICWTNCKQVSWIRVYLSSQVLFQHLRLHIMLSHCPVMILCTRQSTHIQQVTSTNCKPCPHSQPNSGSTGVIDVPRLVPALASNSLLLPAFLVEPDPKSRLVPQLIN